MTDPRSTHRPGLASTWPTVGRDLERAAALAACRHGQGTLICGDAGIGKTQLATEVVAALRASPTDQHVVHLRLTASEARQAIPLGALEPFLRDLPSGTHHDPLGLADAISERLATRAGGHPVLVHADDIHLLDAATAECLGALCRIGSVRLLATARSGTALAAGLNDLWRDDQIERVDLQPLDREEVAALLSAALGAEVVNDTVWQVWEATRGNPFFVREVVRDGLDRGDLVATGGVWAWRGTPLPGRRLTDLVAAELVALSSSEREVVDLVALAEPVPVDSILAVVQGDALDTVVLRGLAVVEPARGDVGGGPTSARLSHPLYAQAVRELVPPARRRQLFRSITRATGQDDGGRESLPQLLRSVSWELECGLEPEVDRTLDAARAAGALHHAEYPIRMASVALDQLADDDPRRIDAWVIRAQAWRYRDEPAYARRDLGAAADLLARLDDDAGSGTDVVARMLEVAELRADLEQYHDDDVDRALTIVGEVRERLTAAHPHDDPHRFRMQLEASRLSRLTYSGRFVGSVDEVLRLLDARALQPAEYLRVVGPTVLGLAAMGRFDEAVRRAEAYLDAALVHAAAAPQALGEIQASLFIALIWSGRIEESAVLGEEPEPTRTEAQRLRFDRAVQQVGSGQQAAAEGRWSDALAHFRAATARFGEHDASGILACSLAHQARAAMALGDGAEARRLRDLARATPLRTCRVVEGQIRLSQALVTASLGEPSAWTELDALLAWSTTNGLAFFELSARHAIAFLGAGPNRLRRDDGLDAAVAGDVDDQVAALRLVAGRVGGPVGPALLHHAEAVLGGDRELAAAHAATLSRLGVWLPVPTGGAPLSRRQREVASLAAAGMSSRDIAAKLHLSVRTVDTHLGHVFTRLGINRRSQLADALVAPPGAP